MADNKFQYQILSTPAPSEVSFRIWVNPVQLRPNDLPYDNQPFMEYQGIPNKPKFLTDNYADYVYTYANRDGDGMWLYFAKGKTDEERDTPFKTYFTNRQYPWPAVLEDLYFIRSPVPYIVFDGTDNVASPRLLPRYRYRPQVSVDSVCKVEQFLSAIEWPRQSFIHPQPIPTDINGSYLGVSVDFPRCLHPTVEFPEQDFGQSNIEFGVGVKNAPLGRNPMRMVFPETNFTDWTPFVISDRQEPTNGVWLREKVTIYPPQLPDSVIQ